MKSFLAFCFLFFLQDLSAQQIKLTYDKQRILLGEQMGVSIKAFADKGKRLDDFPLDTLPHFEVLEKSKVDTTFIGETMQLAQTLTITSWDSGRWALPTTILAGTTTLQVFVDVAFTSPWDPKQPYHDIKGIVPVKAPGKSTWWWYLLGLAVLVALFLLFFPGDKKEKGGVVLDKSAYRKALQQLEKLEQDSTIEPKPLYTELIDIFRGYLKNGKGIQSFSKTTDDLSIQLQGQKIAADDYNALVQTLRLSDLVKFAAYRPDAKLNRDAINIIKQSITTIEQTNAV